MTCIDQRRVAPLAGLRTPSPCGSRGAILVVALILLLVLTLIGITAARLQTAQEGMARNDDNHQLALQSAGKPSCATARRSSRCTAPATSSPTTTASSNLSQELETSSASVADTINWNSLGTQSMQYSGAALGNAAGAQPAQIIIESLRRRCLLPARRPSAARTAPIHSGRFTASPPMPRAATAAPM